MNKPEFTAVGRIAARTAKRNWKRTVLIVALIALPVAASQIAAGMVAAGRITPQEYATQQLGAGDVLVQSYAPSSASIEWVESQLDELASGRDRLAYRTTHGSIIDATHYYVEITDLDLTAALSSGKLALADGRVPGASGEIALSDGLMSVTSASIGDQVELVVDGADTVESYTVVGSIRDVLYRNRPVAVISTVDMNSVFANGGTRNFQASDISWLVDSGDSGQFASGLQTNWNSARASFRPVPVLPRPAVLDFLDDDSYASLSAAQVAQLASFASSLDPGAFTGRGFVPGDVESEQEFYAFQDEVYNKANELLDGAPLYPDVYVQTEESLLFIESAADQVLQAPFVVGTMFAALLMAEVALVAGAAYATGIRRRLREVGLLAVNGATTQHVRWMVVGEGLVSGILGAAAGSVIAVVVMTAGRSFAQRFIDRFIVGIPVGPLELLAPALVGIAAATIAAWIPARTAAKVPAVTALDGRMPLSAPKRWIVPLGAATTGFGAFLMVVARTSFGGTSGTVQAGLGVVLMIAGFALLTGPMVSWVGHRADRFPAVTRLVFRDSARQRTRAATAIAAMMVILVAPIAAGAAIRTDEVRQTIYGLAENPAHVWVASPSAWDLVPTADVESSELETVAEVLPNATLVGMDVYPITGVLADSLSVLDSSQISRGNVPRDAMGVARGTPELLDELDVTAATTALAAGKAVILGVADRNVQLRIGDRVVEAVEVPANVMQWSFPRILVGDDMAATLQLDAPVAAALFVNDGPLTDQERLALEEFSGSVRTVWAELVTPTQLMWLVGGGALLVVLLIVALVTALAATESDHDLRTMVAVGAPPRIRRRFLGIQTVYYTLFAALLATPLALLLLNVSVNEDWIDQGPFGSMPLGTIVTPWLMIGIVLVGIPLVVGGLTALTVRSAATVPPRRLG